MEKYIVFDGWYLTESTLADMCLFSAYSRHEDDKNDMVEKEAISLLPSYDGKIVDSPDDYYQDQAFRKRLGQEVKGHEAKEAMSDVIDEAWDNIHAFENTQASQQAEYDRQWQDSHTFCSND